MMWMMLLRRPLGRLVSLALTAGLAGVLYLTVGKGIVEDVKNEIERQSGGGPQEQRIVNRRNFGPIVKALRKQIGSEAQMVTVTMRPGSVEFIVRDGGAAKGYRAKSRSDDLDDVAVDLSGPGPSRRPRGQSASSIRPPRAASQRPSPARSRETSS